MQSSIDDSNQESMTSLMQKLKGSADLQTHSMAIEALFCSLITNKGIEKEESKFDFIMDDGIEHITKLLCRSNFSAAHINQGFRILFAIAEDSCWHWQTLFDGIGDIQGTISLLERHYMKPQILNNILFMMTKLMEFNVHHFKPSDVVQWLTFFDLVLEGVEENITDPRIFKTFCKYIDMHKECLPPQEMDERICLSLSRGLLAIGDAEHQEQNEEEIDFFVECRQLGQSLLTRFVMDVTTSRPRSLPGVASSSPNRNTETLIRQGETGSPLQLFNSQGRGSSPPPSRMIMNSSRSSPNPFGGYSRRCAPAA